ncbi:MAG: TRZ/ATZ family hydrolase, partial [Betaproteobacteria bacterium]
MEANEINAARAAWLISPAEIGIKILRDTTVFWDETGKIVHIECEANQTLAENRVGQALRSRSINLVDLGNAILCPGLVNAHCHAAMSLFRGAADDLPLMDWLQKRIWPMEGALVDAQFVELGTQLAAAEMLLGGTTTCADMYFYPQDAARAFLAMGMRAQLAMPVIEFPTRYASDADRYLALALEARDALKGEALLSFALGPHAPYTVSDSTFQRVVAYAAELA